MPYRPGPWSYTSVVSVSKSNLTTASNLSCASRARLGSCTRPAYAKRFFTPVHRSLIRGTSTTSFGNTNRSLVTAPGRAAMPSRSSPRLAHVRAPSPNASRVPRARVRRRQRRLRFVVGLRDPLDLGFSLW